MYHPHQEGALAGVWRLLKGSLRVMVPWLCWGTSFFDSRLTTTSGFFAQGAS